jgi:hypothetical protein
MTITRKAFLGTLPTASLHGRSVAEDITKTTVTYAMSSVPEMHAEESKDDTKIVSVKNKNNTMKVTMIIMILTMTNLIGISHQRWDTSDEASRHIPQT